MYCLKIGGIVHGYATAGEAWADRESEARKGSVAIKISSRL